MTLSRARRGWLVSIVEGWNPRFADWGGEEPQPGEMKAGELPHLTRSLAQLSSGIHSLYRASQRGTFATLLAALTDTLSGVVGVAEHLEGSLSVRVAKRLRSVQQDLLDLQEPRMLKALSAQGKLYGTEISEYATLLTKQAARHEGLSLPQLGQWLGGVVRDLRGVVWAMDATEALPVPAEILGNASNVLYGASQALGVA